MSRHFASSKQMKNAPLSTLRRKREISHICPRSHSCIGMHDPRPARAEAWRAPSCTTVLFRGYDAAPRSDRPAMPALSPRLVLMLTLPPLLWAGNAVVGRMTVPHVATAAAQRDPLGAGAAGAAGDRPQGACRCAQPCRHRRTLAYLALVGLLGVGAYNALQYVALTTDPDQCHADRREHAAVDAADRRALLRRVRSAAR